MKRTVAIGVTVVALSLARGVAQQQSTPVFQAGVDLVTLDVRVLDKDGHPVRDLRAEDFQVEIDGQSRPVRALDYIDFGGPERRTTVSSVGQVSSRGDAPSLDQEGRSILVAVDDFSFRPLQERVLTSAAERWLSKLSPSDRIGIASLRGIGSSIDFTSDRTVAANDLRRIVGARVVPPRSDVVITLQEAHSIEPENLDQVYLRECGEIPKNWTPDSWNVCERDVKNTITFMRFDTELNASRQLDGYFALIDALSRAPSPRVLVILAQGLILDNPEDAYRLARRAEEAGIAVFVLTTPVETTGADDKDMGFKVGQKSTLQARHEDESFLKGGLENLAMALHGDFYNALGNTDPVFDRVLEGIRGIYRLGVEAPTAQQKRHDVSTKISVRRRGLSVTAATRAIRPTVPAEILSPAAQLANAVARGGNANGVSIELGTSLSRDQAGTQLALRVNAVLPANTSGPVKGLFALVNDADKNERRGAIEFPQPAVGVQYRAAFSAAVAPGRYHLRFAVADSAGRIGAIERTVIARLRQIGSFYASDLMLSWAGADAQARLLAVDGLPPSATTLRGALELYKADAAPIETPSATVVLERRDNDQPLIDTHLAFVATATGFRAGVQITVETLEPGDYAVVVTLLEHGVSVGTIRTDFRKTRSVRP